jgi:hypothetical protein
MTDPERYTGSHQELAEILAKDALVIVRNAIERSAKDRQAGRTIWNYDSLPTYSMAGAGEFTTEESLEINRQSLMILLGKLVISGIHPDLSISTSQQRPRGRGLPGKIVDSHVPLGDEGETGLTLYERIEYDDVEEPVSYGLWTAPLSRISSLFTQRD